MYLSRLGSHWPIGDALKQEYGLGIAKQQRDVSRILATVYLTTDYIANCPSWQIYEREKISIWFVDLGQEIILQIFGNIQSCPESEQSFEGRIKEGIGNQGFFHTRLLSGETQPSVNHKSTAEFVCRLANFRTAIDLSVLFRYPVWTGPQAKTDYHENN